MEWNFDISEAPTGKTVKVKRKFSAAKAKGYEEKEFEEFQPDYIIAASLCGKVMKTAWNPPNKEYPSGRWQGFAGGENPKAWMPWPEWPHENGDMK